MMHLLTTAAVGVAFLITGAPLPGGAPARQRDDAPPVPFEDAGACPFEGCAYREWVARSRVAVRRQRTRSAPVVFTVLPREPVRALTGVVVTVKPGKVRFPTTTTLKATEGDIRIEPGGYLYTLTYEGEGFTKIWFRGRVYTGVDGTQFLNAICDPDPARCHGETVERQQSVWWVQVQNSKGQIGWTDRPADFDGKDVLGR